MKLLEIRALRGANYYSRHPVIFMKIDLEELEYKPTDTVPGFLDSMKRIMPSLIDHTCSPGYRGGFFERVERGTWAGHVLEHLAIELQCLAGHHVTFGKTYTMPEPGIYQLVFRYLDEAVGLRSGQMAAELVLKLFEGVPADIDPMIAELKTIAEESRLGPSTTSIVEEAARRGIPHLRLNEDSYVQLGYGRHQRRIQATMMDTTSALGVEIADDKEWTKRILKTNGIPVPEGTSVDSFEEALASAESIGYPVVVKPLIGNHGRGVTVNVRDPEDLLTAYELARGICDTCVVEQFIEGFDFRILVINYRFAAAALREPAFVIGNGMDTISQLIHQVNQDPQRGEGHEKNLTRIISDEATQRLLTAQGLTLQSVLPRGEKLYVKTTANISTGGTAVDVTDLVHPHNQRMAERIARLVGLNVMGIDVVAPSLQEPLISGHSGIVEVNAAPGFRMQLSPSIGQPRNIAAPIIDMLFPAGCPHSVPVTAVTGTNGKTTTSRLITHILQHNGNVVGLASTDQVVIDGVEVVRGDYSGPEGARLVLSDSSVEQAVLEVARGGILRRGPGFSTCDVGVLLNISSDHLGEGGIDTLEDLARLKSTVTEGVAPGGWAIFNADDPRVLACVERSNGNPFLFSMDSGHSALAANLAKGNRNAAIDETGQIVVQTPDGIFPIAPVTEIPITFEGKAVFNIQNVLAATAATFSLGLDPEQIRAGLISFQASVEQSRGRMNVFELGDFKVIIDYSHNVAAVHATGEFIQTLMPGRKIRMASGVGNRRSEDLLEFGKAISLYYDHIVLCDSDPRERVPGETARLVKAGLLQGGFPANSVTMVIDEKKAVHHALGMAQPGDLVVLQVDDIDAVIADVQNWQKKSSTPETSDPILPAMKSQS